MARVRCRVPGLGKVGSLCHRRARPACRTSGRYAEARIGPQRKRRRRLRPRPLRHQSGSTASSVMLAPRAEGQVVACGTPIRTGTIDRAARRPSIRRQCAPPQDCSPTRSWPPKESRLCRQPAFRARGSESRFSAGPLPTVISISYGVCEASVKQYTAERTVFDRQRHASSYSR